MMQAGGKKGETPEFQFFEKGANTKCNLTQEVTQNVFDFQLPKTVNL